jgi:hypothetical protein
VLYFAVYPSPDLRPPFFAFVGKFRPGRTSSNAIPVSRVSPSNSHEAFPRKTAILAQAPHTARPEQQSVSPLTATLTVTLSSVGNKRLTGILTPLDATLTKNRGVGAILTFQPSNVQMRSLHPGCSCGTCNDLRSISFTVTFLATPHPLNPLLSHSYKNHRGVGCSSSPPSSFFVRSSRSLHQERFTTPLRSNGSTLFLKIAGWLRGSLPHSSSIALILPPFPLESVSCQVPAWCPVLH